MKYLKLFENYKSDEELNELCKKHFIRNYTINNGLVDVDESAAPNLYDLNYIPIPFGNVSGDFDIEYLQIDDLKNSPKFVGRDFYASGCEFETLENITQKINGNLRVGVNKHFYSIKGTDDKDFYLGGYLRCEVTVFYEIYKTTGGLWDLGTIQEFHMQDLILTKEGDDWICDLYYLNNFLTIMAEINQTKFSEEDYITELKNYKCI